MTSEALNALRLIEHTKDVAEDARAVLETAEREHHDAIIAATRLDGVTISSIARAAGVSRARIYRRMEQPVYGDRTVSAIPTDAVSA